MGSKIKKGDVVWIDQRIYKYVSSDLSSKVDGMPWLVLGQSKDDYMIQVAHIDGSPLEWPLDGQIRQGWVERKDVFLTAARRATK